MKKVSEDVKDKIKNVENFKSDTLETTTKVDHYLKMEEEGISSDSLFKVISREWVSEIKKLRFKTSQCQVKKKRESVFDSKVQSGHAEIEGDNLLFI